MEFDENSRLDQAMLGKALSNMGKQLSEQEVCLCCCFLTHHLTLRH